MRESAQKERIRIFRDLLARALDNRTLGERMGDLAGSLDSSKKIGAPHALKEVIRKRNWRK
jgi:hypothetical protein